jgi:hypothetical protein
MSIFSFMSDAISGIVSSILQQFNFIQDLITAPLKQMISQVTGGIWKGEGANKFVDEMTSEVIPMLASILTGGQAFAGGIKKGQDHMETIFQQATNMAQGLFDQFNNIF